MVVTNSVVYTAFNDETGGVQSKVVTELLGLGIHSIGGGGAGMYGLSSQGLYSASSSEPLSSEEMQEVAVGGQCAVVIGAGLVDGDKSLYSWGIGDLGELGLGPSTTNTSTPMRINYQGSFSQVCAGATHSIVIDDRGNAYAWGQNFNKQLGLYTKKVSEMQSIRKLCQVEDVLFTPRFLPISLSKPIMKVSCGDSFTAVITKAGEIWTWGSGECGQLGTGRCTFRELPAEVKLTELVPSKKGSSSKSDSDAPAKALDLSCGSAHVIVVADNGNSYSWGLNKFGQLGTGNTLTGFSPQMIMLKDVTISQIHAFENCSAVIDTDGYLFTWGSAHACRLMRDGVPKTHDEISTFHLSLQEVFKDMRSRHFEPADKTSQKGSGNNFHSSVSVDGCAFDNTYNEQGGHNSLQFGGMTIQNGGVRTLRECPDIIPNTKSSPQSENLTSIAKNTCKTSFYALPEMVTLFQDQRVSSFTFSRTCSAVLILSKIDALSPTLGPMRNFSRLVIHGEGLWESSAIVVRFTPVDGEGATRSTSGKLLSPREIECRPPKLQEVGVYEVTVAMDGKNFLPQVLTVRIYKEMLIHKIGPSLVDLRSPSESKITVTMKNFKIYDEGDIDQEGNSLWPYESDLVGKFSVKLHLTCTSQGSQKTSTSEVVLPAVLVPLPNLEYDTRIAGSDEAKSGDYNSIVSETNSAVPGEITSMTGGDSISVRDERSTIASVTNASVFERDVVCDVDFTSLAEPGTLVMIRAALSVNDQDFGSPSSESNPTICHSFSPVDCVPSCRPLHACFEITEQQCIVPDISSNEVIVDPPRPCSRSVTVRGRSFIPTNKLPPGLSIEAVIRTSVPSAECGSSSKSKKGKDIYIEKIVSIECDAADQLSLCVPTYDELLSPGENVIETNVSRQDASINELMLDVFFRLVNLTSSSSPNQGQKSRSQGKQLSLSHKSSGEGSPKKAKKKGDEEIPLLSPLPIQILLYTAQPISVEPRLVRRSGGEGSFMIVHGELPSGFNFKSPNVKVELFRHDLDLRLQIPNESIQMVPSDTEVSSRGEIVGAVPQNEVSLGHTAGANTLFATGISHKIVIAPLPPLFLPESCSKREETVDILAISEDDNGTKASESGTLLMEVDGYGAAKEEQSSHYSEEGVKCDDDGSSNNNKVEEDDGDKIRVKPIDFVFIKVLMDGESNVDDPQCVSHINIFTTLQLGGEPIEVPKGGAFEGVQIHVPVENNCMPSEKCIVRLRGADNASLECFAEVTTSASIASPASVAKYFANEKTTSETLEEEASAYQCNSENGGGLVADIGEEGQENKEEEEAVQEALTGLLDTGGVQGIVSFECPDISSLEPYVDGKEKFLHVDVSLDGGVTFDSAAQPLLQVK